jgi:hypothetical protein
MFEEVLPGAANRLFTVFEEKATLHLKTIARIADDDIANAEKMTEATIENTKRLTDARIETSKFGQKIAMWLALISMLGSIALFLLGNNVAGGILLGVPAVLLITAFLKGAINPANTDSTKTEVDSLSKKIQSSRDSSKDELSSNDRGDQVDT